MLNFPQSAVKAERMRSFHSEDSAVLGKAENEAVRKIQIKIKSRAKNKRSRAVKACGNKPPTQEIFRNPL